MPLGLVCSLLNIILGNDWIIHLRFWEINFVWILWELSDVSNFFYGVRFRLINQVLHPWLLRLHTKVHVSQAMNKRSSIIFRSREMVQRDQLASVFFISHRKNHIERVCFRTVWLSKKSKSCVLWFGRFSSRHNHSTLRQTNYIYQRRIRVVWRCEVSWWSFVVS